MDSEDSKDWNHYTCNSAETIGLEQIPCGRVDYNGVVNLARIYGLSNPTGYLERELALAKKKHETLSSRELE